MAAIEIAGGAILGMVILYLIAIACRFFIYKSKNDKYPEVKEGFNIFTIKKCPTCPTCPTPAPTEPCPSPPPTLAAPKAGDACTKPVNTIANANSYKYDKNMNCTEAGTCDAGYIPIGTKCLIPCTPTTAQLASDPTNGIKTRAKDSAPGAQCAVVECLGSNVLVGGACYEPCDTLATGTIANSKKYYKSGTPPSCTKVYECDDGFIPNDARTACSPAADTGADTAEGYTMKDLVEHYLMHG